MSFSLKDFLAVHLKPSSNSPTNAATLLLVVFRAFGIGADDNHSICTLALVLLSSFFLL